jgi:protein-disulfide isomerase
MPDSRTADSGGQGDFPAGAVPGGDGIAAGTGPATVDAYIDFLCPYCRDFELAAGPKLNAMVGDGLIRLVYHPMAFLDEASTTRYSSRAGAAAGCAADGGKFPEYVRALFGSQPPEGGPGLTDAELIQLGVSAGLDGEAFGACVRAGRYLTWPAYVTEAATKADVTSTPTVLVNGAQVAPDPRAIAQAVGAR